MERCAPPRQEPEALKKIVLVVEDHFMTRWGAAEYLRHFGFRVIEAVSVPEAKSILSAGTPVDAVFSDIHMPGGENGYLLAQWLATHYPTLPVLLTSGESEDPEAYTRSTLRHFMRKPYEAADVVAVLRGMLDQGSG